MSLAVYDVGALEENVVPESADCRTDDLDRDVDDFSGQEDHATDVDVTGSDVEDVVADGEADDATKEGEAANFRAKRKAAKSERYEQQQHNVRNVDVSEMERIKIDIGKIYKASNGKKLQGAQKRKLKTLKSILASLKTRNNSK